MLYMRQGQVRKTHGTVYKHKRNARACTKEAGAAPHVLPGSSSGYCMRMGPLKSTYTRHAD